MKAKLALKGSKLFSMIGPRRYLCASLSFGQIQEGAVGVSWPVSENQIRATRRRTAGSHRSVPPESDVNSGTPSTRDVV
jgi:hypothetical protein